MAIEMMSISHCYCSDYMTKPTQFGDEPSCALTPVMPIKSNVAKESKNSLMFFNTF